MQGPKRLLYSYFSFWKIYKELHAYATSKPMCTQVPSRHAIMILNMFLKKIAELTRSLETACIDPILMLLEDLVSIFIRRILKNAIS